MAVPTQYRRALFIGGRILEDREVNKVQDFVQLFITQGLGNVFSDGVCLNVTPSVSGAGVTLNATNGALPMLVFLHGRFESFNPITLSYDPAKTSGNDFIYLNYVLRIVTSVEDPTLIDTGTSQPTANMAELDLTVSATDTSGVALNPSTQYEKNTVPIVMFTLARGAGGSITVQAPSLMRSQVAATQVGFGAVQLTTATSSGVAVATDDARMTNARNPNPLSVATGSVTAPVVTNAPVVIFTNPDATTDTAPGLYPVSDSRQTGGVSSDKLIYNTLAISSTSFMDWAKAKISTLMAKWAGHIGVALGSAATHPMPSASDVGATPASHQNMALGLPGSHPPSVTSDTGGFTVVSNVSSSALLATSIQNSTGTTRGGMTYDGDFTSNAAAAFSVVSQLATGTFAGALQKLSQVARALTDHVNLTSHGNPHGLVIGDLGGASTGYVDTGDANTLANAESYAQAQDVTNLNTAENYVNSNAVLKSQVTGSLIAGMPGYIKLPVGSANFTLQFGVYNLPFSFVGGVGQATITINLPTSFANTCLAAVASGNYGDLSYAVTSTSKTTLILTVYPQFSATQSGTASVQWIAVGF